MNSRIHDLLICRSRHARFPARIAQFDAVAARIEDEELPPGEEPAGPVVDGFVDFDAEMVKELARFSKHVRADVEGMVQPAVLLHGSNEGILTLAKKNIVIAELEAGHRRISQPPDMFQSQNLSIEPFPSSRSFTGIDQWTTASSCNIPIYFFLSRLPYRIHSNLSTSENDDDE